MEKLRKKTLNNQHSTNTLKLRNLILVCLINKIFTWFIHEQMCTICYYTIHVLVHNRNKTKMLFACNIHRRVQMWHIIHTKIPNTKWMLLKFGDITDLPYLKWTTKKRNFTDLFFWFAVWNLSVVRNWYLHIR